MPDIMSLDGERIGTDMPPLSVREWNLLLQYAEVGAFEVGERTKNPATYEECRLVARVVARYWGGRP